MAKHYFSLLILLLLLGIAIPFRGQISTSTPTTAKSKGTPYDSTRNYIGMDVYQYIGQEFYLKGMTANQQKYGYQNFIKDYKKDEFANSNIYLYNGKLGSHYQKMVNRTFVVLDVIPHANANTKYDLYYGKFYIKLKDKSSGSIVYYVYSGNTNEAGANLPFLVLGYLEKLKSTHIGKKLTVTGTPWTLGGMIDFYTGLPVKRFVTEEPWMIVGLTIESEFYTLCYMMENSLCETILMPHYRETQGKYIVQSKKSSTNPSISEPVIP